MAESQINSPFQYTLGTLMQVTTAICAVLSVPVLGRLFFFLLLFPAMIIGILIVLQMPFFLPILLWRRAREEKAEWAKETPPGAASRAASVLTADR